MSVGTTIVGGGWGAPVPVLGGSLVAGASGTATVSRFLLTATLPAGAILYNGFLGSGGLVAGAQYLDTSSYGPQFAYSNQGVSGYVDAVMADSPGAYWRLNDSNSDNGTNGPLYLVSSIGATAVDWSRNGQNGGIYYHSGYVTFQSPSIIMNDPNTRSITFDGLYSYLTSYGYSNSSYNYTNYYNPADPQYIPIDTIEYPYDVNPFSMEVWVAPTVTWSVETPLMAWSNSAGPVVVLRWLSNTFTFGTLNGAATPLWQYANYAFGSAPPIGVPFHIVGVFTGTANVLYFNGVQVASVPATRPQTSNPPFGYSFNQGLGVAHYPGNYSLSGPGKYSDVAVYPTALSAQQVLNHYRAATDRANRGSMFAGNSSGATVSAITTTPSGVLTAGAYIYDTTENVNIAGVL